jgi:hypothetical protein
LPQVAYPLALAAKDTFISVKIEKRICSVDRNFFSDTAETGSFQPIFHTIFPQFALRHLFTGKTINGVF